MRHRCEKRYGRVCVGVDGRWCAQTRSITVRVGYHAGCVVVLLLQPGIHHHLFSRLLALPIGSPSHHVTRRCSHAHGGLCGWEAAPPPLNLGTAHVGTTTTAPASS
jgi:hypothetical protein